MNGTTKQFLMSALLTAAIATSQPLFGAQLTSEADAKKVKADLSLSELDNQLFANSGNSQFALSNSISVPVNPAVRQNRISSNSINGITDPDLKHALARTQNQSSDSDNKEFEYYREKALAVTELGDLVAKEQAYQDVINPTRDPIVAEVMRELEEESRMRNAVNGMSSQALSCPAPCLTSPLNDGLAQRVLEDCPKIRSKLNFIKLLQENDPSKPKQMLLVGPPGTGKTTLAQAFAKECGMDYYPYKATEIAGTYKNDGTRHLQAIFQKCAATNRPCVIAIDEFHVFIEKHNRAHDHDKDMLTTLWSLLHEYEHSKIFFIGMLNYTHDIPVQLTDRFRSDIVRVPLPDQEQREKTIKYQCSQIPGVDFQKISYAELAKMTQGYSNRGLRNLVFDASNIAREQAIASSKPQNAQEFASMSPQVTMEDFQSAMKATISSAEQLERDEEDFFTWGLRRTGEIAVWAGPRIAEAMMQAIANVAVHAGATYISNKWHGYNPHHDRQETMRITRESHHLNTQVQELNIRAMADPTESKNLAKALLVERGLAKESPSWCPIM